MLAEASALWGAFSLRIFILQLLFLISGVTTTLGNQVAYYNGAGGTETLLPALAVFLGNLLAFFTPRDKPSTNPESKRSSWLKETGSRFRNAFWLVLIGVLETMGFVLSLSGITLAGSGLYQVVYSSIVIWIALLSRMFLKTNITASQWLAILIVTGGVSVSAWGSLSSTGGPSLSTSFYGIVVTLSCTLVYATSYISSEKLINLPNAPSPQTVQGFGGLFSFSAAAIYVLVYTVPKWDDVVAAKVRSVGGSWTVILIALGGLTISALTHGLAYYKLLRNSGAVTTGVLQSLRAVTVFYVSSFFFCDTRPEQCINGTKVLSTILVVLGVLYFSHAKAVAAGKPKPKIISASQTSDV